MKSHGARLQWLRWPLAAAVLVCTAWGAMALWYQGPATLAVRLAVMILWGGIGLLGLGAFVAKRWRASLVWLLAFAVMLGWWATIRPSHDRSWADDVARLLRAEHEGSVVTLHNVRNFSWRTPEDYDVRWETRAYDLDRIVSADLVLSYWMGPAIAHTLVSFGFDDGRHLVFSLEIRKEAHEQFSAVGGFFREFEAVLIAADERDIVRTRSNARGEDVYLYRLNLRPSQLRTLFTAYLEEGERLRRTPTFYNTLTTNCTTIVYDIARRLDPGLPLDPRLLLSGYFAGYAYDQGGLAEGIPFETLHARGYINPRARAVADGPDFSRAIRVGVPGTEDDVTSSR